MKKVSDKEVVYTGQSIFIKGSDDPLIENGSSYDVVICELAGKLTQLSDVRHDSLCLEGLDQGIKYSTEEIIAALVSQVCSFSTSDIVYDGAYCNSSCSSSYSAQSLPLMNKKFNWFSSINGGSCVFAWNMGASFSGLPSGYSLTASEIKVIGNRQSTNTIVKKSVQDSGTLSIPFSRFPVVVSITASISTVNGSMELSTKIPLAAPIPSQGSRIFDVNDYTDTSKSGCNLNDVIDGIKNDIAGINNSINSLRNFGGEDLGLELVISQLQSLSSDNAQNIKGINSITLNGGCNVDGENFTIDEAFKNIESRLSE